MWKAKLVGMCYVQFNAVHLEMYIYMYNVINSYKQQKKKVKRFSSTFIEELLPADHGYWCN